MDEPLAQIQIFLGGLPDSLVLMAEPYRATKGVLARSSPAGLAWVATDGQWILGPHLDLLSRKIVEVAAGRKRRLIVTMPPRHGKSELISRFTPAWFLGRFPERKVILCSYSDTFAASWGRAARDVMEDVGHRLFGVTVNQEAKGGGHWELRPKEGRRTLRPGVMTTAGVGGGITGKGADLMIIDDPVKNAQDAQSKVMRDGQEDWWKSTARTRLQPGAGVILVMTRWHEDDLAGRFIKSTDETWEVLNLPAICELPEGAAADVWRDPIGRQVGEALWPEMFDLAALESTRKAMGSYWFGAMYQQRPAPAEGNMFKRQHLRFYKTGSNGILQLLKDDGASMFDIGYGTVFQTADIAGSAKQESDYTVVSTWVVTPDADLIWLDMEDVQFESLDVGGLVQRKHDQYHPRLIGIERIGFGLTVIQECLRRGLPVVRLEPDLDKVSRAMPAVARTEEHRVFLPEDAPWKDRAIAQMTAFPNAVNDDIVDTISYAALMLPNLMPQRTFGQGRLQRSNGHTMLGDLMGRAL